MTYDQQFESRTLTFTTGLSDDEIIDKMIKEMKGLSSSTFLSDGEDEINNIQEIRATLDNFKSFELLKENDFLEENLEKSFLKMIRAEGKENELHP